MYESFKTVGRMETGVTFAFSSLEIMKNLVDFKCPNFIIIHIPLFAKMEIICSWQTGK